MIPFTRCVCFCILLLLLFGCDRDPVPKQAAQQFLDALYLENFTKARELSTASSDPTIVMLEWMKQGADAADLDFKKGDPPRVKQCKIANGLATCTYCCNVEGGDAVLMLSREDGAWKADLTIMQDGEKIKEGAYYQQTPFYDKDNPLTAL